MIIYIYIYIWYYSISKKCSHAVLIHHILLAFSLSEFCLSTSSEASAPILYNYNILYNVAPSVYIWREFRESLLGRIIIQTPKALPCKQFLLFWRPHAFGILWYSFSCDWFAGSRIHPSYHRVHIEHPLSARNHFKGLSSLHILLFLMKVKVSCAASRISSVLSHLSPKFRASDFPPGWHRQGASEAPVQWLKDTEAPAGPSAPQQLGLCATGLRRSGAAGAGRRGTRPVGSVEPVGGVGGEELKGLEE